MAGKEREGTKWGRKERRIIPYHKFLDPPLVVNVRLCCECCPL